MTDAASEATGTGEVASLRDRALARLIDAGVMLVLAGGVALLFGAVGGLEVPEERGAVGVVAVPLVMALAGLVALDAIGAALAGLSVGKALLGLRVVGESPGPVTWRAAGVRGAWGLLEVPLFPVALFVMRRSARHQRWGDRFAGTLVVRAPAGPRRVALRERLSVGAAVAACLGMCAFAALLLVRNEETLLCDQPESASFRDMCLARVALADDKPSLCERSDSSDGRDGCYSQVAVSLGSSWCEKVEAGGARDRCYVSSARTDLGVCTKLTDVTAQARCITKVAAATHDSKVCEPLTVQRDVCLAAAGPAAPNGADVCASRTTPMGRDACYRQKGACDKVEAPPEHDQCLLQTDKGSGTNCSQIISPFIRSDCLTAHAEASQDPSVCEKVGSTPDNPARRHCNDLAFAKTKSASICPGFADSFTRDDCFLAAAANSHAPDLCAKVADPSRKSECTVQIRQRW